VTTQQLSAPSPEPGTISARIADYVLGFRLDAQPANVVRFGKHVLLDTLGCMIAGVETPSGKAAIALARTSAPPEARTAGGGRVAVQRAALANAICANALDLESVGPEGHMGALAVPAALAVAEWRDCDGAALLAATIAGLEVGGRIGAAFRRPSSIAFGGTPLVRGTPHAIFAATIPAAMLLGLDRETLRNAVGIAAYSAHVPTLRQAMSLVDPPMTKYDHVGGMAQSGIDAVRLAQLGFTGDVAAFEGNLGMWRFSGALDCDWSMLEEFGGDWLIAPTFFKTYPSNIYENNLELAARRIVDERGVRPEEIEAIVLRPHRLTASQQGDGRGTSMAQWRSMRNNVAHAIVGTQPFTAWQSGDPPPHIRRLIERMTFEPYVPAAGEEQATYWEGYSPCGVTMRTARGTFEARVIGLKRFTEEELVVKFIACVEPVLGAPAAAKLAQQVLDVERLPRAAQLLEPLG
jgi:2-methylcitrate dehydratase PrpD